MERKFRTFLTLDSGQEVEKGGFERMEKSIIENGQFVPNRPNGSLDNYKLFIII